jgi:oligoribonuclease (3'-5' exoribonuclease)
VDKAATLTKNLENIKSIVGSGGIAKMSRETASLMKQQNKMLENMERLEPLTKQATGLVQKLEGSQLLKTMAQNKGKFQHASEQLSSLKNIA